MFILFTETVRLSKYDIILFGEELMLLHPFRLNITSLDNTPFQKLITRVLSMVALNKNPNIV